MNRIKKEEMNLHEISKEIVNLVTMLNNSVNHTPDTRAEEVERLIKEKIIDILEPEEVYEEGVEYDGLGKYIGIIDTYPFGENYFKRQHHFSQPPVDGDQRKVNTINTVFIREIQK